MFDDLRQAVRNIESLADPSVGDVRVGTHDPMVVGLLPAVFERLRRRFPGISIHVTPVVPSAQQYRGLRERNLDLLLGRLVPPIEEDIDFEFYFKTAWWWSQDRKANGVAAAKSNSTN